MKELKEFTEYRVKERFGSFEEGSYVIFINSVFPPRDMLAIFTFLSLEENKLKHFDVEIVYDKGQTQFDITEKLEAIRTFTKKYYDDYKDLPLITTTFSSKDEFIKYCLPYFKSIIEDEKGRKNWYAWFHQHETIFNTFFTKGEINRWKANWLEKIIKILKEYQVQHGYSEKQNILYYIHLLNL